MLATSVRYVSKKQRRLIQEAAKRKNLSTNQYMLESAERRARLELGRLMTEVDPLVIDKWARDAEHPLTYPESKLQQTQQLGESLVPKANNSPSSHDCACTGDCQKEEL